MHLPRVPLSRMPELEKKGRLLSVLSFVEVADMKNGVYSYAQNAMI